MSHFSLGAIDQISKKYVFPDQAIRGGSYHCDECQQEVILKKGHIRRAHFAHCVKNHCTYFEHPSESQMHKGAKLRICDWLTHRKTIEIIRSCTTCGDTITFNIITDLNDHAICEYRGTHYVADVALISSNTVVKYIFEIKHTHATTTNVRPEPWFEITSNQILELAPETEPIKLTCIRSLDPCNNCQKKKEQNRIYETERLKRHEEDLERIRLCEIERLQRYEETQREEKRRQLNMLIQQMISIDGETGKVIGLLGNEIPDEKMIKSFKDGELLTEDEVTFLYKNQFFLPPNDRKKLKLIKINIIKRFVHQDEILPSYGIQKVSCSCGYGGYIILENINRPISKYKCGVCRKNKSLSGSKCVSTSSHRTKLCEQFT